MINSMVWNHHFISTSINPTPHSGKALHIQVMGRAWWGNHPSYHSTSTSTRQAELAAAVSGHPAPGTGPDIQLAGELEQVFTKRLILTSDLLLIVLLLGLNRTSLKSNLISWSIRGIVKCLNQTSSAEPWCWCSARTCRRQEWVNGC